MSVRNTHELSQKGVPVHLLSSGWTPGCGPDPDVSPTNDRLVHFDASVLPHPAAETEGNKRLLADYHMTC